MAALTVRGKDQRWLSSHRGITEQPAGSNRDNRADGITAAQRRIGTWLVGLPWCGVWAANGLLAAGVKGVSYRLASVAFIEDDAKAGRAPFRDWLPASQHRRVLRGDLAVMFGRGVHVETVRSFRQVSGAWYVITEGGNTSSGTTGSQSNGGGSFKRVRPLANVYGFARVDYPGGRVLARAMMALDRGPVEVPADTSRSPSSDRALLEALDPGSSPEAFEFYDALKGAL
jgi:hypothetical protein